MKEFFRKMRRALQEWFCWLTCRDILDAINEGRSEQEIREIVRECMRRNFGSRAR